MGKKVAQVITLSEMGGAQKHVYLLSKALKEKGFSVDVIASKGGDLQNKVEDLDINFIDAPYMVREISPLKDLKNILYLRNLFKENNYDIVHCHSSKAGLVARIAARLAKVPTIVYTAHGFVFNEPMSNFKKNIYIAIEYIGSKFGKKIIAVSEKDYNCAKKYNLGTEKDLYCIGNAIEEVDFNLLKDKKEMKRELGIDDDTFVLGMVSNFYETKGHRFLIEGLKKLYDEGYNFYTVFAGEGLLFDEMKEKAKGYEKIKFLGYRKDNLNVINTFDAFILSSVKEGMPYVILEAMSLKKPVIATKVGALPKMIKNKENGLLIDEGDSSKIYTVLKDVLDNKYNLKEIGENGKKYVDENFSFESFIDKILKVYKE
ncbi:glycosyltransferase family 4 protein [Clostridium fallax]|uniref:Glycosyltransferase involved in cell wall bisynthesis n=1 Tax=Clostridium fallax TaxID=1533 RepID=A0A1M4WQA8_9CLOT|nr:glycosyltransferase family 4 protein [Clostridium fallax]SHE83394.1 Glycosyltransferase involved in cell wall bisynthesis [Clostridium fallax]SQB06271.1 glycosyltransferase [Clostridium fallax]